MAHAEKVSAVRRQLELVDRSTLVRLAKEHGIKGNLASKTIMEKLIEKGYGMDSTQKTFPQFSPPRSVPSPSKRKTGPEQTSPSKRPCIEVPQPGPSSLRTPQPQSVAEVTNANSTPLPQDHACMPSTYQRIKDWRIAVHRALTMEDLSVMESDPAGYFTATVDSDWKHDCPNHSRESQCYQCATRPRPTITTISLQHSSPQQLKPQSVPPSLARLLNPEPSSTNGVNQCLESELEKQNTLLAQTRLDTPTREREDVWDELDPTDSSSVRHLRVRHSQPQQQQLNRHLPSHHLRQQSLSYSHPLSSPNSAHIVSPLYPPTHAQITAQPLRLHTSAPAHLPVHLPSARTVSHTHSQSFGRTTDSLERTTPSHSYPNTPTPAAAPPPVTIRRGDSGPVAHSFGIALGEEGRGEPMVLDRLYAQTFPYPHAYTLSSTVDPLLLGHGPPQLPKAQVQSLSPTKVLQNENRIGGAHGASFDQRARYPPEPSPPSAQFLNNLHTQVNARGGFEFAGLPMSVNVPPVGIRPQYGRVEDRFLT